MDHRRRRLESRIGSRGHVAAQRQVAVALLGPEVHHGHPAADLLEPLHDRGTDPARPAGDERGTAVQVHGTQPVACRKRAAIGAATSPPTPPPSTSTANETSPR